MNMPELTAFLHHSIADRKLSGGEKTAFAEWLAANAATDQQQGVVRHALFEAVKTASTSFELPQLIEWLEDALKVLAPPLSIETSAVAPAAAFFSPGNDCLSQIVSCFTTVRRTADVCVFTITDDRITRAILAAFRRKVAIRIITDNEKAFDLGSDVQELRTAGVPLRVDTSPYHMHHKFAIFDGARLLSGSYNWTRGAAEQNAENLIDTGDKTLVESFVREFRRLWDSLS